MDQTLVDSFPPVPNHQWANGAGNSNHIDETEDDLAQAYRWAENLDADNSANNNVPQAMFNEHYLNMYADNGISHQLQPIGGWVPNLAVNQFGQMGAGSSANYMTAAPQGPAQPYNGPGTINPAVLSIGYDAGNQTAPLAGMMQQNAAPESSTGPLAYGLAVPAAQQVASPGFVPAQQVPAQEQPAAVAAKPKNRQGQYPYWRQARADHIRHCDTLRADGCKADCELRRCFPQTCAKWTAQRFQVSWGKETPRGHSETEVLSGFAVDNVKVHGFKVVGELLADGTLNRKSKTTHRLEGDHPE